jgi:hypothetical protein
MHGLHKPGDEEMSVILLEDDAWDAWLKADCEEEVRGFLQQFDPEQFKAEADPRVVPKRSTKAAPLQISIMVSL